MPAGASKVKAKIKKGDTVEVISGRYEDKGKRGEVIKVMPKSGRVTVQGISMRKKHQSQVQTQGRSFTPGIIEFEGPIDISNVMLVCPKCDEPTRVGVQRDEDGTVQRVCKKCDALFD
jgi:large subunit ribosomal protein L24